MQKLRDINQMNCLNKSTEVLNSNIYSLYTNTDKCLSCDKYLVYLCSFCKYLLMLFQVKCNNF